MIENNTIQGLNAISSFSSQMPILAISIFIFIAIISTLIIGLLNHKKVIIGGIIVFPAYIVWLSSVGMAKQVAVGETETLALVIKIIIGIMLSVVIGAIIEKTPFFNKVFSEDLDKREEDDTNAE
jgi:hypothetical protein